MCPTGPREPSYFTCYTGKAALVSFLVGRIFRASCLCSAIFQDWCCHIYAALMILFLSPKWWVLGFFLTDATECVSAATQNAFFALGCVCKTSWAHTGKEIHM